MMIGKRSKPMIEKLTGVAFSGSRIMDGATSPRSPLDFKIQSPRGLKSFDFGGVGLAIVAALENSGGKNGETPANKAIYNRKSNRSLPIPVLISSTKKSVELDETEMDSFEDYTIVTCHAPGNKSYTKVYGDRSKHENRKEFHGRKCNLPSVFNISPTKIGSFPAYPDSDFLSSCHMCQKKLHGKDIYMYRGEKAFCSTECRYRQIVMDDHKEKYCSSSRSADVSSSPYGNGQIFATGILAI